MIRTKLQEIGERLREERLRLPMTLEQMSKAAGIALNSVRNYEAGSHGMKIELLLVYQDLGYDIGYVLSGQRSDGSLGAIETALLGYFAKLSDRERRISFNLVAGLAGDEFVADEFRPASKSIHDRRQPFKPERPAK